jgi:pyruvate/2-oxoglutarate dehydrogenase complex dihydrolipoamide acyltransferase (E2) component
VPVTVALHVPKEFAAYVHKEERWSTDWNIDLGKAQAEGITRLMTAMFDHVVVVESVNAGAAAGGEVKAILEPSVEEYAFVTPRDAGSPFFAVSIKYRVNVYSPDGRLADSWGFTGYGTSPSQGLSSSAPLAAATALALRDAGAKLAVEFREQAIVRGLLPDASVPAAPAPSADPPGPAAEAPAEAPAAAPATEPESKKAEPEEKPAATPSALTLASA